MYNDGMKKEKLEKNTSNSLTGIYQNTSEKHITLKVVDNGDGTAQFELYSNWSGKKGSGINGLANISGNKLVYTKESCKIEISFENNSAVVEDSEKCIDYHFGMTDGQLFSWSYKKTSSKKVKIEIMD